jgi:hypothetical protein
MHSLFSKSCFDSKSHLAFQVSTGRSSREWSMSRRSYVDGLVFKLRTVAGRMDREDGITMLEIKVCL